MLVIAKDLALALCQLYVLHSSYIYTHMHARTQPPTHTHTLESINLESY